MTLDFLNKASKDSVQIELEKGNAALHKAIITSQQDSYTGKTTTQLDTGDLQMLRKQLALLYDGRINDFIFEDMNRYLELKIATIDLNNIICNFKIRSNNYSATLLVKTLFDQSYIPGLLNTIDKFLNENSPR